MILSALGLGRDRYDLRLPGAARLSRGVFDASCAPAVLSTLLRTASRATDVRVHLNGQPVRMGAVRPFSLVLACAGEARRCAAGSEAERTAFWGCPVIGVRLIGFSRSLSQAGERFWFSFSRGGLENPDHFLLDTEALRRSQAPAAVCPWFTGRAASLLQCRPASLYLGIRADSEIWRLTPSAMGHAGPIMPRHVDRYERWLSRRLAKEADRP